jgi:hypothetical protein
MDRKEQRFNRVDLEGIWAEPDQLIRYRKIKNQMVQDSRKAAQPGSCLIVGRLYPSHATPTRFRNIAFVRLLPMGKSLLFLRF